jgi:hypothetical protein
MKVATDRLEETRGLIGATGITVKRAETSLSAYDDEVKDSVAAHDMIEDVSSPSGVRDDEAFFDYDASTLKLIEDVSSPSGVRDVEAFFGYDSKTLKHAVRYTDDSSLSWLFEDQLVDTDMRWFNISREHGLPVRDCNGRWRALTGALTRAQARTHARKVATDRREETRGLIGATGIAVSAQCAGELRCLATSVLNLAISLCSEEQKEELAALETSEGALAASLRDDNWPIRMKAPRRVAKVGPGDWLVSTMPAHTDGLRVFANCSVQCFSCDQRISKVVLTEEHPYVKEILGRKLLRVIQLVKPDAAKLNKQQKRKRDRGRKKLAKKAKSSN